jgi:S1-C subfamily serine protease
VFPSARTLVQRSVLPFALAAAGVALLLSGGGRARATSISTSPTTGVVNIDTRLRDAGTAGAGTGIVLSPSGEVLTNNHVIRGSTRVRVTDPATGRSYSATVVGYSLSADIAVLKLANASGLRTAGIGNSTNVKLGDRVTAVGNAGGAGGTPTVTTGAVTGVHRSITISDDQSGSVRLTDLIRTDAQLEPGDSGGPLLDSSGRVIGVDTAADGGVAFRGGGGFAIPVNRAVAIVKLIEAGP